MPASDAQSRGRQRQGGHHGLETADDRQNRSFFGVDDGFIIDCVGLR